MGLPVGVALAASPRRTRRRFYPPATARPRRRRTAPDNAGSRPARHAQGFQPPPPSGLPPGGGASFAHPGSPGIALARIDAAPGGGPTADSTGHALGRESGPGGRRRLVLAGAGQRRRRQAAPVAPSPAGPAAGTGLAEGVDPGQGSPVGGPPSPFATSPALALQQAQPPSWALCWAHRPHTRAPKEQAR